MSYPKGLLILNSISCGFGMFIMLYYSFSFGTSEEGIVLISLGTYYILLCIFGLSILLSVIALSGIPERPIPQMIYGYAQAPMHLNVPVQAQSQKYCSFCGAPGLFGEFCVYCGKKKLKVTR
jgi:hypothetical protein